MWSFGAEKWKTILEIVCEGVHASMHTHSDEIQEKVALCSAWSKATKSIMSALGCAVAIHFGNEACLCCAISEVLQCSVQVSGP